jgi:2-dehydro-3-deoxy-D-arabinonate dehydratase
VLLCKFQAPDGAIGAGCIEGEQVRVLGMAAEGSPGLSDILHADSPGDRARQLLRQTDIRLSLHDLVLLPPIDSQEVWGAGVTYRRSREARENESAGAAQFYNLVCSAPRPELFFKAMPCRVVGPGGPLHVRSDSRWTVPEPELALVVSPRMKIVGFTIGNDMSARDIEGENPLYLPQAKTYRGSCALGPAIALPEAMPSRQEIAIQLTIERCERQVFSGDTSVSRMHRTFEELIDWLGRECDFPSGVILLTGTGIVPPDDFSLQPGDRVHISVSGIGCLTNEVR